MSAHTRKHPTSKTAKFTWHGAHYSIPVEVIEKYKVSSKESDAESIESVFGDLIAQYGEPGLLLKGLRTREGLNQIDFAKSIGVTQQNLSAMENGRRTIGKDIAKRISKKYGIDYRIFL